MEKEALGAEGGKYGLEEGQRAKENDRTWTKSGRKKNQ